MSESSVVPAHTPRALGTLITDERIGELQLRVSMLERERSAWEQERAAWMLATAARPMELVLSLPSAAAGLVSWAERWTAPATESGARPVSLASGLRRIARRASSAAFSLLRRRLPV